jgi:hypothetical protein
MNVHCQKAGASTHTHTQGPSDHAGRPPGSMTAVMRAIGPRESAKGPKLLRIGLVQGGRVIEDRIVKDRGTVTVGASEAATFVIAAPSLRPLVKLFERSGDGYVLHVTRGMTGRVALESGVTDLATTHEPRLFLTPEARGKVSLGDSTFLFQFVAPPLPASRPQLPLAVKGGLASQIDWNLTIIAAFSFLVHFGVIGSMYSDWMDPILDTGASANGVVDLMSHLPTVPLETPVLPPDTAPSTSAQPAPTPVATTGPRPVDHPAPAPRPMTPTDVAALSAAAEAIGVSTLTVLGSQQSATARALGISEIPPVDLGKPAASIAGVEQASGNGIHFGPGATTVRPGESQSLAAVAFTRGGPGRSGQETDTAGPSGIVTATPLPAGPGGDIGAPRVVAGLRAGFRSCYNQGLGVNPQMSGKVTLVAHVGPNGEVASTESADNAGLSPAVVQCLLKKLGTAEFDKGHGMTTVKIPAGFLPAAK